MAEPRVGKSLKARPINIVDFVFELNKDSNGQVEFGHRSFSPEQVYCQLFEKVPWPRPIPRPEKITFEWDYCSEVQGRCFAGQKLIQVSCLYKDRMLNWELYLLITHQAAHFIWDSHTIRFRRFLESVGIPYFYRDRVGNASALYRMMHKQFFKPRYTWQCPTCRKMAYSDELSDTSCRRCSRQKSSYASKMKLVESLPPVSERLRAVFGQSEIVDCPVPPTPCPLFENGQRCGNP